MSAKPDKSVPFGLLVDRGPDETRSGAGRSGAGEDPVAELARSLMDHGAATCVTDRRGELIYANAAYERIAIAVAEAGLAPINRAIKELPTRLN